MQTVKSDRDKKLSDADNLRLLHGFNCMKLSQLLINNLLKGKTSNR